VTFAQHAVTCTTEGHGDCVVIIGVQDGVEVWWSHMDAAVAPEARIGPDYPEVEDRRGPKAIVRKRRAPTAAEARIIGVDRE
jgi:hypothetical protein